MKRLINVVGIMIMLLVFSVLSVSATDNGYLYEKGQSSVQGSICDSDTELVKIGQHFEALDEEYYGVIEDFINLSHKGMKNASSTHQVSYTRTYLVKRTSDNAIMVQFDLHGTFEYNGSTSSCKSEYMTITNNAPNLFTTSGSGHKKSGIWAMGNCVAKNIKTGTLFYKVIKIGVSPTGAVSMP